MSKTIGRNVNDLKLLIDEDLVEHESIRSFGLASEDNYIINPKNVIQEAIDHIKSYDFALKQYKETLEELIENNDGDVKEICVFLLNLLRIKEIDIEKGFYI